MTSRPSSIRKALIFSEIGWGFLRQRHHHLAEHLAGSMGAEVHFFQGVPSRTPPLSDLAGRAFRALTARFQGAPSTDTPRLPERLKLHSPRFLPYTHPVFRQYDAWLARRIALAHADADLIYLFCNNPAIVEAFTRHAPRAAIVMDIIHNWWEFPWLPEIQRRNIVTCLADCSLIVSDSPLTLDRASRENPAKATHLMLPGVGPEWFSAEGDADTAQPDSSLTILFFGNLRGNSDVDLLNRLAALEGACFEGYGLLDRTGGPLASDAVRQGMRPPRSAAEIAQIARRASLVVLPYANDAFSRTISPAKYFESLASGALIISRAALDHLPGWSEFVLRLPSGAIDGAALREAVETHRQKRHAQISFAASHCWNARFKGLMHAIARVRE
jgi:glycosyltransferase involved in cell wall biosynthesis